MEGLKEIYRVDADLYCISKFYVDEKFLDEHIYGKFHSDRFTYFTTADEAVKRLQWDMQYDEDEMKSKVNVIKRVRLSLDACNKKYVQEFGFDADEFDRYESEKES